MPNRLHRGSPIGRSDDAAPIYDLCDSLDETWTSWMRDIRLARARLIVPDGYMRNEGAGRGASFDDDREVWHSLRMPPNEGNGITLNQFDIKVEEHRSTTEANYTGGRLVSRLLAPVVRPRRRRSASHRDRGRQPRRPENGHPPQEAGYWRRAIAGMVHALLLLHVKLFGSKITPAQPRVEFGDGVAESAEQTATTLDLINRVGAVSTATKVKIANPTWDDTSVQAKVRAILAETGAAAPDPVGSFPHPE